LGEALCPFRSGKGKGKLHGERGEERFRVEFNSDQWVWYDLHAFLQPSALARLALTGFLLDTNCISEVARVKPEPRVMAWIEAAEETLL
jgi:Domain of unknown function (DUF1990)